MPPAMQEQQPALETKVFCPQCSQKIMILTRNLPNAFRCPRCRTVHQGTQLVDPSRTLHAIPTGSMPVVPGHAEQRVVATDPIIVSDPKRDQLGHAATIAIAQHPVAARPQTAVAPTPTSGETPNPVARPQTLVAPTPMPSETSNPGAPADSQKGSSLRDQAQRLASYSSRQSHRLMNVAERIDGFLHGKRLIVFAVAAGLSTFGYYSEDKTTSAITAAVFFLVCAGVLLANMGACRDQEGKWSVAKTKEHVDARVLSDLRQALKPAPLRVWVRRGSGLGMLAGYSLLGLANIWLAVLWMLGKELDASGPPGGLVNAGLMLAGVGTILIYSLIFYDGRIALKKGLRLAGAKLDEFRGSITTLPRVVRCSDPSSLAPFIGHREPLIKQVFEVLADWKPKAGMLEKWYEDDLAATLRRLVPESQPRTQIKLGTIEGRRRKGDLVVGDALLIELKRSDTSGEEHRAQGQMRDYGLLWKKPMLLLYCDVDADALAPRLASRMASVEEETGTTIITVFANMR
jgi:hypothetical protein